MNQIKYINSWGVLYTFYTKHKMKLDEIKLALFKLCIEVATRTFCAPFDSTFRVGFRFGRKFCKLCELLPACSGARFRGVVADLDIDSKSVSPKKRMFC